MGKHASWLMVIAVLTVAVLLLWQWAQQRERAAEPPVAQVLAGLDQLAAEFPEPGDEPLAWPRDHGAKPEQFAESWLFAGLLHAHGGGRYGFQLAFSRVAVQPETPARPSAWRTQDIYRARLSVEPAEKPARSGERLSRDALGLAGSEGAPPRVWVEDWSFEAGGPEETFLLRAAKANAGLELRLAQAGTKPMPVGGPAYRGYWWPGLAVEGTILMDGESVAVTGQAMLERLWGRALPAGQGQLALARLWIEDGAGGALRCEQLRRRVGGGTPLTECLGHPAMPAEIALEPVPEGGRVLGGISYPLSWNLDQAAEEPLRTRPLSTRSSAFPDGSWSGIVGIAGRDRAWGLLELSNFAEP
jgi:predicted secreted hydrolase